MSKGLRDSDVSMMLEERADPIEREAAIKRLGAAGRYDLEPQIRGFMEHDNPWVRAAAFSVLLAYWRRSDVVPVALALLRPEAYAAPEQFWRFAPFREVLVGDLVIAARRDRHQMAPISEELVGVLRRDESERVHLAAYRALLRLFDRFALLPSLPVPFVPERDVDWARIAEIRRLAGA